MGLEYRRVLVRYKGKENQKEINVKTTRVSKTGVQKILKEVEKVRVLTTMQDLVDHQNCYQINTT